MVTASAGCICATRWRVTARYTSFEAKSASNGLPLLRRESGLRRMGATSPFTHGRSFVAAVGTVMTRGPADMALAATLAGMGFVTPGYILHANVYPIAGRARVPSVGLSARTAHSARHGCCADCTGRLPLTFEASPERHMRAARLLGGSGDGPDLRRSPATGS